MKNWIKKYGLRLLLNLLAWSFIWSATYSNNYNYTAPEGRKTEYVLYVILLNSVYVIGVYVNSFLLMPRFLFRKQYVAYIVLLITCTIGTAFVMGPFRDWLLQEFKGVNTMALSSVSFETRDTGIPLWKYCLAISPTIFFLIFIFGIGRLSQQYFALARQKEIIEQQQISAELNLLKSQINPHFLFNVLNSIYSLSLKKSDETPSIVLKLSEIMRYMLYETRQQLVPAHKEIQLVQDYLDIERIRMSQDQTIDCKVSGSFQSYLIAPALLITFVENAIKHGTDSMSENAYIRIHLSIEKDVLIFNCVNNYKKNVSGEEQKGGIGLTNVRKRLSLLYPDMHELDIRDKDMVFEVSLKIKLNK